MFNLSSIQSWYQTEAGKLIFRSIEEQLWKTTACMFGYVSVEVGRVCAEHNLLKNCTIRQQILLDSSESADVLANPAALPIRNDSVDLFLLTHTLDFTSKPHEVLREVERSLVAEGHLIIVGFNPYSFYGVWKALLARRKIAPWNAAFYSIRRIRDWCSLLGFEELSLHFIAHIPPFKRIQKWKKMQAANRILEKHFTAMGGVYIFVARKRVARLTPLMKTWPAPGIFTGKIPNPTVGMKENG